MEQASALVAELRRHWDLWLLIAAAAIGVGVASYLTLQHYDERVPLVCSDKGIVNCGLVTTSSYSYVPGTQLPITIPGLLFFLASGGLAVVALLAARRGQTEPERLRGAHVLLAAGGLAFVLYLVWAEIVKLHAICAWCTVVHALTLITFFVAAWRFQHRNEALPVLEPDERPARLRKAPPPTLTRRQRQTI